MYVEPAATADVVDLDDVRMVDLRHRARLEHESLDQRDVGLAQLLERDVATEVGIAGAKHDAHRAGAEPLQQLIAPERRAVRARLRDRADLAHRQRRDRLRERRIAGEQRLAERRSDRRVEPDVGRRPQLLGHL